MRPASSPSFTLCKQAQYIHWFSSGSCGGVIFTLSLEPEGVELDIITSPQERNSQNTQKGEAKREFCALVSYDFYPQWCFGLCTSQ